MMSDASVSLELNKGPLYYFNRIVMTIQTCFQLSETGNSYNGCVVCPDCNLISHSSLQLFSFFIFSFNIFSTYSY